MKTFEEFVNEQDPSFLEDCKCDGDKDKGDDKGKKKFPNFLKKGKDEVKEEGKKDDGDKDDKKPFPAKKNPFLKGKKDKKED